MPTLNIDVNARTEKAKRDLRALDREVLKISKSEAILEKALKKAGDVGSKEFRKIQGAAVRQARAVNTSALQFKQLRAQMTRLGAGPATIGKVTSEFIRFRKEMERGVVGTTRFQKAQDRLKATLGTTRRQLASTAAAANKVNAAAMKGGKGITGLGHTLENLGSTAVLVAGPLSGVGSRLIAFGAIAKRGSLLAAGFFSAIAGGSVIAFKAINAFDALNLSLSKTEAILKATGKEVQITSKFVEEAAARVARRTLANLEDTRPGAAALLSFKGIDADNLERVLTLSQDVSSLGLTDFTNALKLLGRASEDPIKNLDSLRRVGIQLTSTQKDQITTLQNMGRGVEAFNVILDTMEEKVGGTGESQNQGLAGGVDRLGQSWTHFLETLGEGALYNTAVGTLNGIAIAFDWLAEKITDFREVTTVLAISATEGLISNFKKLGDELKTLGDIITDRVAKNFTMLGAGLKTLGDKIADEVSEKFSSFKEKIGITITPELEGFSALISELASTVTDKFKDVGSSIVDPIKEVALAAVESQVSLLNNVDKGIENWVDKIKKLIDLKYGGVETAGVEKKTPVKGGKGSGQILPSPFKKALIDVNIGLKRSIMDLNSEEERLRNGFILTSPRVLKLAEQHKVLGEAVKMLKGDFSGLNEEGRKIADMVRDTNEALLNFDREREGLVIREQTRSALVKYNDELKRLIFLYDNGYIKLNNLIIKQKELRATLESTTPELNILTGAADKFGDSLSDLIIKGENFAEGLKSIFKSLVDDITKQFFKLAVINPILNGIFGASSGRPEMGSQGGGRFGLGGAGGLLGMAMGGADNDNSPQKAFGEVAVDFEKEGLEQSKNYGAALQRTNARMAQAGGKAAGDFGDIFSNMAGGVASAVGGGIGSFLGNLFADVLGFQHGGSFKVGGSGGRDSQLVAFKASPRERVSVETPGQQNKQGSGNVTYIDARGVDPGQMDRLIQVVRDLDESVEIRAVNATADARDRNPSLFGRTL